MTTGATAVETTRRESDLPRSAGRPLNLARSLAHLAEARKLVPGVTNSLMKRPEMFALGAFPVYLADGRGALVRDVDGNEYIDFICGLGANTLGHKHPAISAAIRDTLEQGILHSLPVELELQATRALVELIPGAEMARFFKTGADATSAAVRLARHLTGKHKFVAVGYNGWHDHFMFDTPGVPPALRDYTLRMPLASEAHEAPLLELVAQRADELALVLLSLPYNRVVSADFLRRLREQCRSSGVLFVLDEVVTGFRLALGGAQQYYGIDADFVCLSKGIAAGMPLSAIAGPASRLARMEELQVSTTFGGELLSLAACQAALRVYRDSGYIEQLRVLGRRLREGVNRRAERRGAKLRVVGYEPIPFFLHSEDLREQGQWMERFLGALAKRGVIIRRDVNFLCGAHSEAQIDFTINAVDGALAELGDTP